MTQPNNGGPAFPRDSYIHPRGEFEWPNDGMSLRAWLAGQALASIGSDYHASGEVNEQAKAHAAMIAEHVCNIADAIIAKLEENP